MDSTPSAPASAHQFKVGDKVDYYWRRVDGREIVWQGEVVSIGRSRVGIRVSTSYGRGWGGGVSPRHLRLTAEE